MKTNLIFTVAFSLFFPALTYANKISCKSAKTGHYLHLVPRYAEIYLMNKHGRDIGYEDCLNTRETKLGSETRLEFLRQVNSDVALTIVNNGISMKAYYQGDVFFCQFLKY